MADLSITKVAVEVPIGIPEGNFGATKYNLHAVTGQPNLVINKLILYSYVGISGVGFQKFVVYAVVGPTGPPTPPENPEGPNPVVHPPEDCPDGQDPNCCVPDLNRVIEARVGPLNTMEDLRVAIWYLQDRHNVLVREFNKLATVTRPNPPSV